MVDRKKFTGNDAGKQNEKKILKEPARFKISL